jgi:hypothetical protein
MKQSPSLAIQFVFDPPNRSSPALLIFAPAARRVRGEVQGALY